MTLLLKNNLEVKKIFKENKKTKYVFYALELADEFLAIYEKCPDKIKRKLVYQNERVGFILFFSIFLY